MGKNLMGSIFDISHAVDILCLAVCGRTTHTQRTLLQALTELLKLWIFFSLPPQTQALKVGSP